jgi:hypothetical protein
MKCTYPVEAGKNISPKNELANREKVSKSDDVLAGLF